jgi:hypothetical protein
MAFVVEDGTGLSSATSLVSLAAAKAYWTDRGGQVDWDAENDIVKQTGLIRASDYVRNQHRYRWIGAKKTYAQTMPWPRTGVVERDGTAVPDNVVPWRVAEAVSYLAARALTEDLSPDLSHGGGVQSESVDALSVSYFPGFSVYAIIQAVDGMIAPLLRLPTDPILPFSSSPEMPSEFVSGTFDNV